MTMIIIIQKKCLGRATTTKKGATKKANSQSQSAIEFLYTRPLNFVNSIDSEWNKRDKAVKQFLETRQRRLDCSTGGLVVGGYINTP